MPIPSYQEVMLPLLKATANKEEYKISELVIQLAEHFQLTEQEKKEMLPSGTAKLFHNRVHWAKTYLSKAGLLNATRRAHIQISDVGLELLKTNPKTISNKTLQNYDSFNQFTGIKPKQTEKTPVTDDCSEMEQTPQERLQEAWKLLHTELSNELLAKVKSVTPLRFEEIVVKLLVAMGYGGSFAEAAQTVGQTGDGGIDGIISEDRLGLDKIYLQAKRWENTVPIKEVRDFAGALLGKKAHKGVFLTTSGFPSSAFEYVQSIDRTIILIDGKRLAQLMIEHNVGVAVKDTFLLHDVDEDFFE